MTDEGRSMEGGNPSNFSEKFLSYLWRLTSLLLQLLPVGNGQKSKVILIDTEGEWYTNGMANEGRNPSVHVAQWRVGNSSNYCAKFLLYLWRLTSLLLQLLPVRNGQKIRWHIN